MNLRDTPITRIEPHGIRCGETFYDAHVLILATGFDALTGSVLAMEIKGARGADMAQVWCDGPVTLLGTSVPGFPNFFNISGPGCPGVLANMIMAAEHQLGWVYGLIRWAEENGYTQVEARQDAAEDWTQHLQDVAGRTLFTKGNTWYLGSNIDGKARVFMPYLGGLGNYVTYCDRVRDAGFKGFVFAA